MSKKVGIHICGRHLEARKSEEIMWGKAPDILGEITMAMKTAFDLPEPPAIISFGTGASNKDGTIEADFWAKFTMDNINRLHEFECFKNINIGELRDLLKKVLYLENKSLNTNQEMTNVAQLYREWGIDEMIIVSAPTHLPRCAAEMLSALEAPEYNKLRKNVQFRASEIPYDGCVAADVVVVEPPHRGDDFSPPFYKLVRRIFQVAADKKSEFYNLLEELLAKFKA
jgi:hypothetical protein